MGFYDPLVHMIDHAVAEKFLRPEHRNMLLIGDDIEQLIENLENFKPVIAEKWIERLKQGEI